VAFDRLSGSVGEPLLLVMGLGTSRFWWPAGLCQAFADQGFAVARYDQRDAGQSTRMPDTAAGNPFAALFGKRGAAYSAEDMADDAIAVMDALGWDSAHVFGHSLGGTIAQRIALRHPERVLSLVSSAAIPSDVSGLGMARYLRFGLLAKLARMKFPEGREGDIEASLAMRTRPGSGSNARWTAGHVTRRHRAGRSVHSGTARNWGTFESPSSFFTASRTRSCASAPAVPRPE
jgi:pimeloyl-ACP methyl ester carboxylesterase